MLLRRITEHVKAQNWTAVALDFVIVVVGVFIGIQVSNWNASRVEHLQSRDLLSRMASEAQEAQQDLRLYRQRHAEILDHATRLAMRLQDESGCLVMDDEMKGLIWAVGDFPPPRFSLSNAVQALNTGHLAIIQSVEIRDGVQAISDELTFMNRQWERYIRIKQDTEQAVIIAGGVAVLGPRDSLITSSQSLSSDRYKVLTPEKICGQSEIIASVSNVETTQLVYSGYLYEVQNALDHYVEMLSSHSESVLSGGDN